MPRFLRLVALLLGVAAATCSEPTPDSDSERAPGKVILEPQSVDEQRAETGDLEQIRKRGVLRILVSPRSEQALRRPESEVRLERDLARHFAERFEIDAQIVQVASFDDLIPELLAGRGDIVAGQMTVTKARMEKVAFTRPVDTVSEIVVGPAGEQKLPRSPPELEGWTIHITAGSAYLESLEMVTQEVAPNLKIVEVPGDVDVEDLAYDVSRGDRPLTVVDSNRLVQIETYNRRIQRLFALREGRQLAWAVRPGNPKLKAAADAFLVEAALTSHAQEASLGDLADLKARGSIRLITRNNALNYYLHGGQPMGFDYELAKLLADSLGLRLEVVVPPSRDQLIPYLLEGKGDIIGASLTVTPEREAQVAFSTPYLFVDEVLVNRTDGKRPVRSPGDLQGRTIAVRESSSYFQTLKGLTERFGFELALVSEGTETETLIAQVSNGEIDLTVADTHILAVERLIHGNIDGVFAVSDLAAGEGAIEPVEPWTGEGRPGNEGGKRIAFALRPGSAALISAADRFVKSNFRGLEFNILRKRYFGDRQRAAEAKEERSGLTGELSPYDDLIKKYSEQYGLDWRLMSSLAFQESRFDPKARSWVGAVGLFQVMPATGRELGFKDLLNPDQGTHAGIKYLHQLIEHFEPELDFRQRVRFALASYNAGFGHVDDARRLAAELGLNPNKWFGQVEKAMLLLQDPRYYKRARYGFVRGEEPVKYVSQIQLRYDNYVKLFPR